MTTTDEHLTECAHPAAGEVALPEYAVTVAECGDPQPVIDGLTEWLHEQTPPQIPTEPDPAEDDPAEEPEPAEEEPGPAEEPEPIEGEEIDDASEADHD